MFIVLFIARAFPCFVARAYIIVLYSDVGGKLSINGYHFIFLVSINVCPVTERAYM